MSYVKPTLPTELHNALQYIVDQYNATGEGEENSRLVYWKDVAMELCEKHGYMTEDELHCKQMGIFKGNRDGEGVVPTRANKRLSIIVRVGYSQAAIRDNLVGIYDNPFTKEIEAHTLVQCALDESFAQYKEGEIKGGTLGAGHATHGFAQLHDERPCSIENISEHGKMSKSKCYKDPGVKRATEIGNRYKMFRWEIGAVFPAIPTLVQSALNTVTQTAEGRVFKPFPPQPSFIIFLFTIQ